MIQPDRHRGIQLTVRRKNRIVAYIAVSAMVLIGILAIRLSVAPAQQTELAPFPFPVIFSDSFDLPHIDLEKWQLRPGVQFTPILGSLVANSWLREDRYDKPALYSRQAFVAQPGRALVTTMRVHVLSSLGPYALFSPSLYQSDPLANSIGTGFHRFWDEPFSHFWIWYDSTGGRFLRATAIVNGTLIPYWNTVVEGIDHVAITSLRQTGSYHLMSGGDFGEFPTATLVWVNDQSYEQEYYAGIEAPRTQPNIMDVKVLDLDSRFSSQYGLAHAADTFVSVHGGVCGPPTIISRT